MKLNGKKVKEIMTEKNLTEEMVCTRTGLCLKSLQWILVNGFASRDALERIADAIGKNVCEIVQQDGFSNTENVMEFTKDSDRATVSFSQGRYITKIKKLATERPNECEIVAENKDGSICAHIPTSWIRITPTVQLTEEQREQRVKAIHRNILDKGKDRCENG